MASLQDSEGKSIYLSSHHVFGRLHGTVDTNLERPVISRIHAVVEWSSHHWQIRDLSRNGSWLNHVKLVKDSPAPLTAGDIIQLGEPGAPELSMQDDHPPMHVICRPNDSEVIPLESYHLLPNANTPELVIYQTRNQWCLERVGEQYTTTRLLSDRDWIQLEGLRWQLRLAGVSEQTSALLADLQSLDELTLTFHLSQDEESTLLSIETEQNKFNLQHRSHHYLTLNLARYRAADASKGLDLSEQGWIYTEQLSQALGLTENSLNIHIHRARRQFSEFFSNSIETTDFIQRRNGKVRLGCRNFKIYKGDILECTSNANGSDNDAN